METRIVPTQVSHAVTLAQTNPTDWAWRVLTIDGAEAVAGQSTREDVAREHAEFFRRSLDRLARRRLRSAM